MTKIRFIALVHNNNRSDAVIFMKKKYFFEYIFAIFKKFDVTFAI
jgi:hypothetical protein